MEPKSQAPPTGGAVDEPVSDGDRIAVAAFFSSGTHWDYLWSRVSTGLDGTQPGVQRAIAWALGYQFASNPNPEQRAVYGPFEPRFIFEDRASAPQLPAVDEVTKNIWFDLYLAVAHPTAQARLGDLLWSMRYGERPHEFAHSAIDAYLSLAGDQWPRVTEENPTTWEEGEHWASVWRADCLQRALELALELGDRDRVQRCADSVLQAATQCHTNRASLGALYRLLAALLRLKPAQQPQGVRDLVIAVLEAYRADIFQVSRLTDLAVQVAQSEDERRALRETEVRAHVEHAEGTSGIERAMWLQEAIELARQHGVPVVEELRLKLDQLERDDGNFGRITVPIDIPAEDLEAYVASFVRDDWRTSLRAFAIRDGTPPSGDAERNRALVEELRSSAPLQFVIPAVITDANGRVVDRVETDEEHDRFAVLRHETLQVTMWANLTHEILTRALAVRPTHDELTGFFSTELIRPATAERIAAAVEWFLDKRFDESAHVLVPRIEAVIRELALAAGVPVAREPFGSDPGGVATLGTLLRGLAGRLDESWLRYLLNALVEHGGLNLRNRISHGLLVRCGPGEAGLLIHIACYLAALQSRATETNGQEPR